MISHFLHQRGFIPSAVVILRPARSGSSRAAGPQFAPALFVCPLDFAVPRREVCTTSASPVV